jgi:ribosomal protein S18 acetylase RimI-like enzyme
MIERAGAEVIDELEPLWNALREHQGPMLSALGPTRERTASWALRREKYAKVLADEGFVVVARDGGRVVGYALVAIAREPSHNWAADVGASVETLSVLPGHRGAGLGSRLMDRVRGEVRAAGIDLLLLGVVAGNERAERFYARQGFTPAFIEMAQRI